MIVRLERKQSEEYMAKQAAAHIEATYPQLSPATRARLTKKLTRESLKSLGIGGCITVALEPATRWERFKARHFPRALLRFFPVRYPQV